MAPRDTKRIGGARLRKSKTKGASACDTTGRGAQPPSAIGQHLTADEVDNAPPKKKLKISANFGEENSGADIPHASELEVARHGTLDTLPLDVLIEVWLQKLLHGSH